MNLCWFRQDLRLSDNPALRTAMRDNSAVAVFILEETENQRQMGSACKAWLHKSLSNLKHDLEELNIPLILKRGDAREILPQLAEDLKVENIYWNRRYDPKDVEVDRWIMERLNKDAKIAESLKANLLFEPWEIKSAGAGTPYKVFSPFWKAALKENSPAQSLPAPTKAQTMPDLGGVQSDQLSDWQLMPQSPDWSVSFWKDWEPGEAGARKRLDTFLEMNLQGYGAQRDVPSKSHTSLLSPHLRFGEISPRQVWHGVHAYAGGELSKDGHKYLAELGWREFSHSILFYADDLAKKNWKPNFDAFAWQSDSYAFKAWTKGQTGYPLVDAGMRELWQTGYMHNRVRMVAASFLIKHLRIDWRDGEKWFWDTLVDACPANNPASWQWVAGSGADASPFFRIFNPIMQSQKFDAGGDYIRKWVPEISKLDDKSIHTPWDAPELVLKAAGVCLGSTYPKPIVDHKTAREKALAAYKDLTN